MSGKPSVFQPKPLNAMSCGFTNDATASQGASSSVARQLGEEVDDLLREHAVAHEPGVGLVGAVRLAADPPREPERIEAIGAPVGVDRDGIDHAVDVVGPQALVGARRPSGTSRSGCEMCHLPR